MKKTATAVKNTNTGSQPSAERRSSRRAPATFSGLGWIVVVGRGSV
jgi:hypothetical protein